jgi:hypothetical protein
MTNEKDAATRKIRELRGVTWEWREDAPLRHSSSLAWA